MPVFHGASRLALCLLTFVLACGSTEPDPTPGEGEDNDKVAALTLSPNGATLLVGESLTLAAQAVDDTGQVLKNVQVTWSSYLPEYATVANGRVKGVAVGGSVITAKAGAVSATLSVIVMPTDASQPSSDEVLASAREAGLINDEELLAYQVYAAFSDPRLPLQYKARVKPGFDVTVLETLRERFDSLSAPMQEELGMYLLRPDDPGSWLNAPLPDARLSSMKRPSCRPSSAGWYSLSKSTAKVKVWFEFAVTGQREQAQLLDEAIEKDIWPKLMALGLKAPLTDEDYAGCNGGSSQLDLYLVRNMGGYGLTLPEGYDNTQAPTYIQLWDGLDDDSLKAGAAHELMHAIQWASKTKGPQNSYGWIRDATANWAIDQVYGQSLQLEQQYADCFMSTPDLHLENRTKGHCTAPDAGDAERDYGAYLFFQYLSKKHGPSVVVAALDKLTTETSSLTAVDSAVPGKLEKVWPEFAKVLWNQAPIDTKAESFKAWDKLTEKAKFKALKGDLAGAPELKEELGTELNNLANSYHHFTFSDPNTRSLLFHNGWFKNITESKDPVKVLALWNDASGTWHEEDWSEYEYVGLCRDMKSQRAQDLIIITSNAKFAPGGGGSLTAAKTPYLKRSNVGCWKYKGTSKAVLVGAGWSGRGKIIDANLEYQVLGAFATADYDHPNLPHTKRLGAFMILAASGDFTLDIGYSSHGCNYSFGPTKYSMGPTGGAMLMNPFNELKSPDPDTQEWLSHPSRAYRSALGDGRIVSVAVSGKDCQGPELDSPGNILFTDSGEPNATPQLVKPNGELSGTLSMLDTVFSWTLQPQIEP
ncbi:Ig-like domain-containing protein [Corallococcus praedator]|uniref:Ig-like domain-containing protein n=2 Tax=Corallococcus TaxID=83461 RepID=A0ABX9QKY5_9BACT|nr:MULTISPECIES: Ig-like domain-containing protein [Corallococcus]RKH33168.1 Ig-like domain-containing protein [Corallococcus sp. CA031C]RKI11559.1 Ig-like domain-containing protein [Corallococcus praedator]